MRYLVWSSFTLEITSVANLPVTELEEQRNAVQIELPAPKNLLSLSPSH